MQVEVVTIYQPDIGGCAISVSEGCEGEDIESSLKEFGIGEKE